MPTEIEIPAFLARCRELAAEAKALGDPAVGAVVVFEGKTIGEGVELGRSSGDVTRHAQKKSPRRHEGFLRFGHRD
jgi:tRNA(adenine34) deaminase